MALQVENIADLLVTTQKQLGKFKFTDAVASIQNYHAFKQLMRKGKASKYDDGTSINWQVMVDAGAAARMVGLYATDITQQGDYLKTANIPWRHCTHNYLYDSRELAINAGPSRILDIMKVRRYAAWLQIAEKLETQFWSSPVSGSDDIHGIPYHIVKNASEGFNGGHASGHSDWAGLSRTTYTNLKNYTYQYSNVTKPDFVRGLSAASDRTNFMPPVEYPSYSSQHDYAYCTTRTVRQSLKELLEAQNDNLGNDIDSKNGLVTYRRTRVDWVPKLDSDTDNPFYGINYSHLRPAILTSLWMKEQGPHRVDMKHTVFVFYIDLTMNLECTNPREQFVLATGTSGSVS